jgi:hypothetical protein
MLFLPDTEAGRTIADHCRFAAGEGSSTEQLRWTDKLPMWRIQLLSGQGWLLGLAGAKSPIYGGFIRKRPYIGFSMVIC